MPRPLSSTVTELSVWMRTMIRVAKPACASSTALSTTSQTMWCSPERSSVSPMYIPGRLRTASGPLRTLMLSAVVALPGQAVTPSRGHHLDGAGAHPPHRARRQARQHHLLVRRGEQRLAVALQTRQHPPQHRGVELGVDIVKDHGRGSAPSPAQATPSPSASAPWPAAFPAPQRAPLAPACRAR